MKIIVRKGQFFADGFAVRHSFLLEEGERRLISYIGEGVCGCARLSLKEGKPIAEEGSLDILLWKEGAELLPPPPFPARPLRRIKTISVGNGQVTATCLCGAPSEIILSGVIAMRHRTKLPLFEAEISPLQGQREAILCLRGKTAEGEYLALFALGGSGAKLLLEEAGDRILCEGNEVTVERAYHDLRERKSTLRYLWQGETFSSSREIVCTKDHTFLREECGRLLLEAVLAKDEREIKNLLSPEIADPRGILDYFGEIDGVRPSPFSESPTAYATVRRQGPILRATLYDFDLDHEGKIANVRCLDE